MEGPFDEDEKTDAGPLSDQVIPGAPPVPPIEVVIDRVTHDASVLTGPGQPAPVALLYEIWTLNRIYVLDTALKCVEVKDRKTGAPDDKHAVLGTRLVGGQRRYGKTLHITKPLPIPGTEAIFERATAKSASGVTSRVERVLLRVQITSVVLEREKAWEDVSNAFLNLDLIRKIAEGRDR